MPKKIDHLRIFAVIVLISSIIYFDLNLLSPKSIPYYLRFWPLPKNMNILVMGTDIAYDKGKHVAIKELGHTDAMILMNMNTSNFKVNMLSIPRDTLVEIPDYGWQKVNSAYFLGGAPLAKKTVEKLLGVPINHYIVINTSGLKRLINLMGGVWVYVDKDMYYVDNWGGLKINLKQGWQKLNGEQAHGFVRYRQDPLGDVSRVQRQQGFMQTVMKQMAKPSVLAKAPWVLAIAYESIKTDLSLKDILCSLNFARGLRKEDMNMMIVPGKFSVGRSNAGSWDPDEKELQDIMNKYFSKRFLAKLEPSNVPSYSVTIIDNTGDIDSIKQIMKMLYKQDFSIVNVPGIKKPGISKSVIIAQSGDKVGAEKLGKLLGISDILVSGTGDVTSDFTVVVCSDWRRSQDDRLNK